MNEGVHGHGGARRPSTTGPRTVTFESDGLSIMVTLEEADRGSTTVRGWVTSPGAEVELRERSRIHVDDGRRRGPVRRSRASSAAPSTSSSATTTSRAPARSSPPESRSERRPRHARHASAAFTSWARPRTRRDTTDEPTPRCLARSGPSTRPGRRGTRRHEDVAQLRARILITRAVSRLGIEGPEAALSMLAGVQRPRPQSDGAPCSRCWPTSRPGPSTSCARTGSPPSTSSATSGRTSTSWSPANAARPCSTEGSPRSRCGNLDGGRADLERGPRSRRRARTPRAGVQGPSQPRLRRVPGRRHPGRAAPSCARRPRCRPTSRRPAACSTSARCSSTPASSTRRRRCSSAGSTAARRDRQPMERGDVQLDLARSALLRGDVAQARVRAGQAVRTFRALHADAPRRGGRAVRRRRRPRRRSPPRPRGQGGGEVGDRRHR